MRSSNCGGMERQGEDGSKVRHGYILGVGAGCAVGRAAVELALIRGANVAGAVRRIDQFSMLTGKGAKGPSLERTRFVWETVGEDVSWRNWSNLRNNKSMSGTFR